MATGVPFLLAISNLDRDQRDEPRVDYVGHVDEGQARAPGSAVRAGAGDSRRGVRARRRRSARVPDAEWESGIGVDAPQDVPVPSHPAVAHGFRSLFRDCATEERDRLREVIEAGCLTSSRTGSRRPSLARLGMACSSGIGSCFGQSGSRHGLSPGCWGRSRIPARRSRLTPAGRPTPSGCAVLRWAAASWCSSKSAACSARAR